MGLDHGRRISRFKEAVEIIRRLYTEETVTFTGQHFQLDSVSLALKPSQKPRPAMWFGGSVDNAVKRAALLAETGHGDSWVASSHLRRNVIVKQAKIFKDGLEESGKPIPTDFPVLRNIVVAHLIARRRFATSDRPLPQATMCSESGGLFTDIVKEQEAQAKFDELIRRPLHYRIA